MSHRQERPEAARVSECDHPADAEPTGRRAACPSELEPGASQTTVPQVHAGLGKPRLGEPRTT